MNFLYSRLLCALFVFAGYCGMGYAYTPVTWLEPFPCNLFAQPCVADVHSEQENDALWQGDIRTNFFAIDPFGGYGLAVEGSLRRDDILRGVFGKIYMPVGLAHWDSRRWEPIAELSLLLGLSAVKSKRFGLDVYALGKIPQKMHELRHNNFSGGFGSSCFIRICGTPKHHLDCLTEADVLFHAPHVWRGGNYNTSKDYASYKIQSALAYRFKHFVSDLGWHYDYLDKEWEAITLFTDIGWLMHCGKLPSYITFGAGAVLARPSYPCSPEACAAAPIFQLKFGLDF